MFSRDCVAARKNLRLDGAGNVHQVDAPATRIRGSRGRRRLRFFPSPLAENVFGGLQHFIRVKIANEQQQGIFRCVEFAVDRLQIFAFVRLHLRFARRNLGVRMRAE